MSTTGTDDRYLLVHAYCDGELDPVNAKAIEQQISADPSLAAERDRIMALRRALHGNLPARPLPRGLRDDVMKSIGRPRHDVLSAWNKIAASILVAIALSAAGAWYIVGRGEDDIFIRELTASHARALIAARVTDVNSSDQHTIKPWFSTRTAQAPRIVDLTAEGYPLVGGRLDVIEKIPVPTLVYGHREHFISLTEMPASATTGTPLGTHAMTGFNIIGWAEDETSYWATSDIELAVLKIFVEKFRAAERQR
ncbi:MAG TPA: anti-sigma factor [Xanthobacteraceae bacterium]|nr:anti-sigma factor [Xanthobacteraceae bacterium]